MCTGTELTRDERVQIYTHLKDGISVPKIAKFLGRHKSTIYREIKRCKTKNFEYDFEISQKIHEENISKRVRDLAIGKNKELANYIDYLIIKKRLSPEATIGKIINENRFKNVVCFQTVYRYIDKGFLKAKRMNLYHFGKRRVKKNRIIANGKFTKGTSIEERPQKINDRSEFGHFEGDLILNCRQKGVAVLTLTERVSRFNINIAIPDKTQKSVINALDELERILAIRYNKRFCEIIKSITFDNGIEFMDYQGIEKSCLSNNKRTTTYYCHAYSSHERGSNERNNGLLRKFGLAKSKNFNKLTSEELQESTNMLYNYPRGLFNYHCASEIFSKLSGLPKEFQSAFMVA